MRWPWQIRKPEKRSDAISRLLHQESGADYIQSRQLSGVQIAAGIVGRAFATLKVDNASESILRALTPHFFGHVGRSLILDSESLHFLHVGEPGLELVPVASWHIEGGSYSRADWRYRIYLSTPTGAQHVKLISSPDVIHVQAAYRSDSPWLGSGLGEAKNLVRSAQRAEQSVSGSLNSPVGKLVPAPLDADDTEAAQALQERIAKMAGEIVMVESQGSAWGSPVRHESRLQRDWGLVNLSPDISEPVRQILMDLTVLTAMQCGIPSELTTPGSAQAKREGIRVLLFQTLRPIARLVEHELRIKLEAPNLSLDFGELGAIDVQNRARAYASLIKAKMSDQDARHLAGLD